MMAVIEESLMVSISMVRVMAMVVIFIKYLFDYLLLLQIGFILHLLHLKLLLVDCQSVILLHGMLLLHRSEDQLYFLPNHFNLFSLHSELLHLLLL